MLNNIICDKSRYIIQQRKGGFNPPTIKFTSMCNTSQLQSFWDLRCNFKGLNFKHSCGSILPTHPLSQEQCVSHHPFPNRNVLCKSLIERVIVWVYVQFVGMDPVFYYPFTITLKYTNNCFNLRHSLNITSPFRCVELQSMSIHATFMFLQTVLQNLKSW